MQKKQTESGAKAHQRIDFEDRAAEYKQWHRTLHKSLFMLDVDAVEWRIKNHQLKPVGLFELTRVDAGKAVTPAYLQNILDRFFERDMQAKSANFIAHCLTTKAYITLFRQGCIEFWVYCLSNGRNGSWNYYSSPQEYETFLKNLE